jgi:hypothetical protein
MNLDENTRKIQGPTVHFTLLNTYVDFWSYVFSFPLSPFCVSRYQFKEYAGFLAICFLCLVNCCICSQPKLFPFMLLFSFVHMNWI